MRRSLTAAIAVPGLVLAATLAATAGSASAATTTLYVSPTGHLGAADTSCKTARYSVIQNAISAAPSGATVWVCAGTYTFANQGGSVNHPLVLVNKPLTLHGQSARLNALGPTKTTGAITGITVTSSNVTVYGFFVYGAVDEGILAENPAAYAAGGSESPKGPSAAITGVHIVHNVVDNNDKGFSQPNGCTAANEYFGDCGGGIHFNAVAHSTMVYNKVFNNTDGILLTDEAGPTDHNVIAFNYVVKNPIECGITLVAHTPNGATVQHNPDGTVTVTGLTPSKGGTYDNVVHGNLSAYNGTAGFHGNAAGSGAGVVLATFLPGGAVYGNSVSGNKLYANGLAGVVVHFHYPGGEFGGGNSITGNAIGKNNVNGDTLDAPITTSDMATTGIVLLGAPLTLTTVNGNVISNDTYGIWHNPAMALKGTNTYHSVTTPVKTERVPFGSAFCGAGPNGPNRVCSGASHTSMTLTGLGVANGYPTSYHFNYGTSRTALTSSTTPASLGKGATVVAVSTTVNHLSPHTTYYFQLVLTNRIGTASGVILSFTTA